MAVQKRFIAEQDNEIERVNARFDEELAAPEAALGAAQLRAQWAAGVARVSFDAA